MPKIVLLVHHRFCQAVLTAQLSKKGFEVCAFKLPETDDTPSEAWMEKVAEDAIAFLKDHLDAVGVVVETNLGYPAFEGYNRNLLERINEIYDDKVKKIAYSGTEASLQKTLNQFPKMFGIFNSVNGAGFKHEKIINHQDLIKLLKPKKRSRSMAIPSKTKSLSSIEPSASSCDKSMAIEKCFSVSPRYIPYSEFSEEREKEKGKGKGKEEDESHYSVDKVVEKLEKISLAEHSFSFSP